MENIKNKICNIAILGSTGSIGTQALNVIEQYNNNFRVMLVSANTNINKLKEISRKFDAECIGIHDIEIKDSVHSIDCKNILFGRDEIVEYFLKNTIHTVVFGTSGIDDYSILEAIYPHVKRICIASKEIIVMAGVTGLLEEIKKKCELLPVDSEHAAVHQLLDGARLYNVNKVILTASGGPFYSKGISEVDLNEITPAQALKHPTWNMGKKVTIDSASMANKGIELLEAHYLFSLPSNKIDVVIHPQSIIHAMIEWNDGSVVSQNSWPDMRLPISYAIMYPKKMPLNIGKSQPFYKTDSKLSFIPVKKGTIKTVDLSYLAMNDDGIAPIAYMAGDEIAVEQFLNNRIKFKQIPCLIEKAIEIGRSIKFVRKDPITAYRDIQKRLKEKL
ncbi:MAG: 1-deoxy-D-xylulose-5-phosphate reductoisomerase [Caldisericia bacterium]|nr:1-deoxy-D-xylulose-5-phosphate reductoisomerase [Caldisericia bacterium]